MRVLAYKTNNRHASVEAFNRTEIRMPFTPKDVLEVFGGEGTSQTVHYAAYHNLHSLTAWDIDPERARVLKELIPDANVKVCDAFKEVHSLQPAYDVIVIDNNVLQAPRFEHFDLFPAIFKGLKKHSFIIISVCSDPGSYYVYREAQVRAKLGSRTEAFVRDLDNARSEFYGIPPAAEEHYALFSGRIMPITSMSANDMVPIYTDLAIKAGFFTAYQTVLPRARYMSYIVLELKHASSRQEMETKTRDKLEKQRAEADESS